jgi:hypothetical protein
MNEQKYTKYFIYKKSDPEWTACYEVQIYQLICVLM